MTSSYDDFGQWFRILRDVEDPALTLYCFPYAGASPEVYRTWCAHLSPKIRLISVHYPGRERRVGEPLLHCISAIVEAIAPIFARNMASTSAFFGHSMGAYVAYHLARLLENDSLNGKPDHLFISGAGAPHIREPNPIHKLNRRDFLRELIKLNGIPHELMKDSELIAYCLPILRADFTACETNFYKEVRSLSIPISVMGSENDGRVDLARLKAWRAYAGISFDFHLFEGDHFFVNQDRQRVIAKINDTLLGGA